MTPKAFTIKAAKTFALTITVLLVASTAHAQEGAGSIVKKVALDPTTYAPALIMRYAARADWRTSQPLFALGAGEMNARFTVNGISGGLPISASAGYHKIDKIALRVALDSAMHNAASHFVEAQLLKAHPDNRKLIKAAGIVERIAVGSTIAYMQSSRHFKQVGINERMLAGVR